MDAFVEPSHAGFLLDVGKECGFLYLSEVSREKFDVYFSYDEFLDLGVLSFFITDGSLKTI